jgi:hypothetical protein
MKITHTQNGQTTNFQVTFGTLNLVQTITNGVRFNEAYVNNGEYLEFMDCNKTIFQPLFVALHNYKIENCFK